MVEIVLSNLIKIILGVVVFVVVVAGVYLFFKESVVDFFDNLVGNQSAEVFLSLF